jgi:hypothetical protein
MGRVITRKEMVRLCREKVGVTYSSCGLSALLSRGEVNLKQNADRSFGEKQESVRLATVDLDKRC